MIEKGYVVSLRSIELKTENEDSITPSQLRNIQHLLISPEQNTKGTIMAVICSSIEEGVTKIRNQVIKKLNLREFAQENLCFTLRHQEVIDGMFYNTDSFALNEKFTFK